MKSQIALTLLLACLTVLLPSARAHGHHPTSPPPSGLPSWWNCIGSDQRCRGYEQPCPSRRTVETAMMEDMVRYAVFGKYDGIYDLLDDDVVLTMVDTGITITGAENVAIYLTSANPNGTRAGYYTLDSMLAPPSIAVIQQELDVSVVINQTSPLFGLRMDLWQVKVDERHFVKTIDIFVPTFKIGEFLYKNPSISYANVIDKTHAARTNYTRCLGRRGRCHGFERPCRANIRTVADAVTRYIAYNVNVNGSYDSMNHIFTDDAYFLVPNLGVIFQGKAAATSYFSSGDPTISDPVFIVQSVEPITTLIQNDYMQVAIVNYTFYSFGTKGTFINYGWWLNLYRADNELSSHILNPDTFATVTNLQPGYNVTPEALCAGADLFCTGVNNQFPVPSGPFQGRSCLDIMSTMPAYNALGFGNEFGFNRGCKAFHLALTQRFPEIHCAHVGFVNTPCVDDTRREQHVRLSELFYQHARTTEAA